MTLTNIVKYTTTGAAVVALAGCATMFGNSNRQVSITSKPSGANVYFNGSMIGTTPQSITVADPMNPPMIRVSKSGYYSRSMPVSTAFQGAGFFNILFWPGFIVDYATGDMRRVDPTLNFSLSTDDGAAKSTAPAPKANTETGS